MSSSMPWVKLYVEMLDDPKMGRLTDSIKWRFVSLILLAGECDQDGALIIGDTPMSEDDIAWRLRVTREQCVTELGLLLDSQIVLLDPDDHAYYLPKFSERQGRPQNEKRKKWRDRKAKQRENEKLREDVTQESRVIHVPREEKNREEKSKRRVEKSSAAKPPIPPAVIAYKESAFKYPSKSLYEMIDQRVGCVPERVSFWKDVVRAYIALGWNPTNITGQLEWFDRNELPHKNGQSANGQGESNNPMLRLIAEEHRKAAQNGDK